MDDIYLAESGVTLKPIPNHWGYWAGDDGQIYSTCGIGNAHGLKRDCKPKRKTTRVQNSGYLYVGLSTLCPDVKYRSKFYSVHRLVARAWLGEPRRSGHKVRHMGGKTDNRPCMLAWGTKDRNYQDNGNQGKYKLTDSKVRSIRQYLVDGASPVELRKAFCVGRHAMRAITEGLSWRRAEAGLNKNFRTWQRQHLTRSTAF